MGNSWDKSPTALHYIYYEMPTGEVKKSIERGDMVDELIKRLGWAGLKIIKIEKKRET